MKILSIYHTVLALFLLAPSAYGRDCTIPTPEIAFESATMVFIGKVVGGTEKQVGVNEDDRQIGLTAGEVTFAIEAFDIFKERIGHESSVIVRVPRGLDGKSYEMVPGERYFVYADGDFYGALHIGQCTRTALLAKAEEDIEFIRRLREIGHGTIKSYISLDTHDLGPITYSQSPINSLPNVSVKVTGPDGYSRTIQIDKSGNFEITGLRAGIYRLTPQLPIDYESTKETEEVRIAGFVKSYPPAFTAQHKSRISGIVKDVNGVGFDQRVLALENATTRVPGGSLDSNGRFEIRGVPPGEYVMSMEFRRDDRYEKRKYYYPGTYDASRATKIKFGLSDLKRDFTFRLPAEFRVQKLSGAVSWSDGKPAQGVQVFLSDPSSFKNNSFRPENFPVVLTDTNGRFSLTVIGGVSHWLRAIGYKNDVALVCSTPIKIVVTKDRPALKLVLSNKGVNVFCPVPRARSKEQRVRTTT